MIFKRQPELERLTITLAALAILAGILSWILPPSPLANSGPSLSSKDCLYLERLNGYLDFLKFVVSLAVTALSATAFLYINSKSITCKTCLAIAAFTFSICIAFCFALINGLANALVEDYYPWTNNQDLSDYVTFSVIMLACGSLAIMGAIFWWGREKGHGTGE